MRPNSPVPPLILLVTIYVILASGFITRPGRAASQPIFTDTAECDQQFWDRTYNPSRLQVIQRCISVTGTVEEVGANSDGDYHMLLRLETGQENLLKRKNMKNKKGRLVLEIVCANPVQEKKVGTTCNGFSNPLPLPKIGDRIKVWGSYVIDTNNGWAEIHPVTKILPI